MPVYYQLSRTAVDAVDCPLKRIDPRIFPSTFGKQTEHAVDSLDIHAQHHALIAVFLCSLSDDIRIADGTAVDADFICTTFQYPVKVF